VPTLSRPWWVTHGIHAVPNTFWGGRGRWRTNSATKHLTGYGAWWHTFSSPQNSYLHCLEVVLKSSGSNFFIGPMLHFYASDCFGDCDRICFSHCLGHCVTCLFGIVKGCVMCKKRTKESRFCFIKGNGKEK